MRPILRKVDIGYDASFSIREDIYPYLYNHWHYHPEVELTLIRKGTGVRLVGDSMEQFDDGDLILLGANLPHMWRSDAAYFKGLPDLHIEAIAIHFREDFWGSDFLNLPELRGIRELLQKSKRGLKITGKAKQTVSAKMEAALNATGVQRIEYLLGMLNVIAACTDSLSLSSAGFGKTYDLQNTDKINLIYTYTFNNFQQKISIQEAAAAANISPHSFCRYFKTRTLKTYWQFVQEVRIGYACRLLIENKLGVSQICFNCGYNNLSNFNRQFKAVTGKTPLQYVKEYLRRQSVV
ncbi:AraC family transcriptional regulator [Foetidibacter luteolus]|uniref:AraC family transcriptional regulator n=1 Tax=Foetidibacter luteolus TaxID=2608880 RepID=UPI00129B5CAA|nr:AraC family transcriptional regulator [Foetidibacter luteolus]